MNVRPFAASDWDKAFGLDRPEVQAAIAEGVERLLELWRTRPEQSCSGVSRSCVGRATTGLLDRSAFRQSLKVEADGLNAQADEQDAWLARGKWAR